MSASMRPQKTRNSFLRASRQHAREVAQARQVESAKRTPEQQLTRLDTGGFVAAKERKKIQKRIETRKVQAQEKKPKK